LIPALFLFAFPALARDTGALHFNIDSFIDSPLSKKLVLLLLVVGALVLVWTWRRRR